MECTTLGDTGLRVSRLALGCWQFSGDATWGAQDRKDSLATVHAAREAGINFFDTAEMYGDGLSETILGEALQDRRQDAVIATKVSQRPLTGDTVRRACEASLKRLKTDWIDLYQIHYWDRQTPIEECVRALLDLKDAGKIRAIGTCNSGTSDIAQMTELVKPATNQMPYSLLWRAIEYAIQPLCLARGIGILAYSPLAQGLLAGRFKSPEEVPDGRARTRLFSQTRPQTRMESPERKQKLLRPSPAFAGCASRPESPWSLLPWAGCWPGQEWRGPSSEPGGRNRSRRTRSRLKSLFPAGCSTNFLAQPNL